MSRIRVLHVHTLPVVSGSGINTYLTMKGMPGERFETALACAPGGRLNEIVREAGMDVHEVRNLVQPIHPLKDILALFEIIRIIRREKIDIVHTHNSKAGFLGRLAGKLAGTPVVIHTVHGFAFHQSEPLWRRTIFRLMEKLAAPWADHTIFISQPMIDWAREEGILRGTSYSKIYSGIDLDAFHGYGKEEQGKLREELGLGKGSRVIGFVSKLWEGKGHEIALHAMVRVAEEIPDAKLLLVGEGPLKPKLIELARKLGIEQSMVFAGFRTKIAEITSLCELCILPSFFEGMGRVLLEAGACGKPVVASRVGGIPDVIVDGVTGFLVPSGDPAALSEAVLRLMRDPGSAVKMGEAARKRINEKYDVRTMVREITGLYDTCLSLKGRATDQAGRLTGILNKRQRKRKVG
ncbi:MAG: glycosyltransferase family 4 protein [bacterium]